MTKQGIPSDFTGSAGILIMEVMMGLNKLNIGKILMSIATIQYGFVPPFVDFNSTHATNPLWTGHARFHVVWQVLITFCLGLFSIYLIWMKKADVYLSLKYAFLLGLSVLVSFFVNIGAMSLYAGSLSDPNGVPPILGFDANLISFSVAFAFLLTGFYLVRTKLPESKA